MSDLIRRSDVLGYIRRLNGCGLGKVKTLEYIRKYVERLPSADRPQGEWIYPTDVIGFGRCNNCKALWDKSLIDNIYFKYCPRCGARMEGADDD